MSEEPTEIVGVLKSKCFCDHENQIQCLNCFAADAISKWRQIAMHWYLQDSPNGVELSPCLEWYTKQGCEHCEWVNEWSKGKPND